MKNYKVLIEVPGGYIGDENYRLFLDSFDSFEKAVNTANQKKNEFVDTDRHITISELCSIDGETRWVSKLGWKNLKGEGDGECNHIFHFPDGITSRNGFCTKCKKKVKIFGQKDWRLI